MKIKELRHPASSSSVKLHIESLPVTIGLVLILIAGAYLRLTGVTNQSMWLDELHTMVECNPDTPSSQMYHYLWTGMDPHPPLYFTTTYFWFKLLGYNDFTARLLSVFFGVLSIYAIYLLGKEIHNRSTGIIAALLTCINYYNIYYSHEARNYICTFFFATLSFYALIRLIRNPIYKTSIFYGLITVFLLHSHYYGMITLAAQLVILLFFLVADAANRKQLFTQSLLAGAIILTFFSPWIEPVLLQMKRESIWISKPESNFFIVYFAEYFGNAPILIYLFSFILLFYLIKVFLSSVGSTTNRDFLYSPLNFSFYILFIWITLSYLLPYVRSLIGLPMLFPRYTIVTLPAFLVAIAIGIDLMLNPYLKRIILFFAVIVTLVDLHIVKDYYHKQTKQTWKQLTEFVVANNSEQYPIITDRDWYTNYYFGQFNFKPTYFKADSVRSYTGRGIWIMTGHTGSPVDAETYAFLDSTYTLTKEYSGIDTWAKLFKKAGTPLELVNGTPFTDGTYVLWGNASIETRAVLLTKGRYELTVTAYGSRALEQNAHVRVYLNEKQVGEYFLPENLASHDIYLTIPEDLQAAKVRIEFDNDNMDPATGRDRNAFIKSVQIANTDQVAY